MLEINKTYNYNCLEGLKLLSDSSIDCCVTSPPYWNLRDYGVEGQLGNESHFNIYIQNLCDIFIEVKRVLKPRGTCFVNIGDTYGTQSGGMRGGYIEPKYGHTNSRTIEQPNLNMHKCLLMIPARFAIEMIDKCGWILRNQIIWHKPNQMPNSAIDRFTVDFEELFFFTKQPQYYFEQQFDPYTEEIDRWGGEMKRNPQNEKMDDKGMAGANSLARKRDMRPNKEGRNKRTVWSINTEPCSEEHFAVFPQHLPETPIKAGCPANGIVLDPFMGSGTTGVVARKLGRNFIGFELNPKYIKLSEKRLYNELGMYL